MDGIATITQRIAQIQSQIAAVQAPARPTAVLGTVKDGVLAPSSGAVFSQVLDEAIAVQAGPAAAGSTAVRLNADGVPVDLAAYGNGKIPASALAKISGTGHSMWAPAAQAYEQLAAAAAKDGVTIGITDSYRSYEAQVDVAQRKGLYSQGGLAAAPGTSDHGWGLSLDLRLDAKAQEWMRANGGRFGYVEDVPREPWHWTFTP